MKRIGLVGKNGSGKSLACEYLKTLGFQAVSLSDVLRDILTKEGKPLDRDTLTHRANELKLSEGTDVLAKRCWLATQTSEKVVFDSIRHPSEAEFLVKSGVCLIGTTTSLETRYNRIASRGGATDHIDFETFKRQDEREASGDSAGQNLDATLALCHKVVQNDDTIDAFYLQLKAIVEEGKCPV